MLTNDMMQYKIPSRQDVGKLTVEFARELRTLGTVRGKIGR